MRHYPREYAQGLIYWRVQYERVAVELARGGRWRVALERHKGVLRDCMPAVLVLKCLLNFPYPARKVALYFLYVEQWLDSGERTRPAVIDRKRVNG